MVTTGHFYTKPLNNVRQIMYANTTIKRKELHMLVNVYKVLK